MFAVCEPFEISVVKDVGAFSGIYSEELGGSLLTLEESDELSVML